MAWTGNPLHLTTYRKKENENVKFPRCSHTSAGDLKSVRRPPHLLLLSLLQARSPGRGSPSCLGLGKCCIPPCIVFDSRCVQVVVVHKFDQNKMPHTHPLQPPFAQNGGTTQH